MDKNQRNGQKNLNSFHTIFNRIPYPSLKIDYVYFISTFY